MSNVTSPPSDAETSGIQATADALAGSGLWVWSVTTRIPTADPKVTQDVNAHYVARTIDEVWKALELDRMDERTELVGIYQQVPILKILT